MVIAPIIAALVKSEDMIGKNPSWQGINADQKYFLERLFVTRSELARYSATELRSWASRVAAELNKILQEEGFDIQLDEFGGPNEFGVVSILNVLVEWLV